MRDSILKYKNVLSISFAHFIHDIFTSFLKPLLPLLIDKLSISYTLAGALTVFPRIPSLFNTLIGHIIEHHKLKYFVIFTPLTTAIFASLLGIADTYLSLSFLLLAIGLSSSLFHVPAPVLVKRISNNATGTGMSFFMIGGELARSLGPILIMFVVSYWGLESSIYLIPLGLFASVLLYLSFKKVDESDSIRMKRSKLRHSLFEILKLKRLFLVILGASLTKAFTASVFTTFLPIYLSNRGVSRFLAGSSLSIIAISGVLGVSLSGPLSDKFGRRSLLILLTIFSPIILIIFLLSPLSIVPIMLIPLGFICLSTTPILMALVQDHSSKIPSVSNGLYMTINFLLSSLIVLLAGKASDYFGVSKMLYSSAILGFLGIPLIIIPIKKEN